MATLSLDKLKKKISYCRELVEALTVLEPGLSTQRGLTLYELWKGELELAQRLQKEGKLDREANMKQREEALKFLEESSR